MSQRRLPGKVRKRGPYKKVPLTCDKCKRKCIRRRTPPQGMLVFCKPCLREKDRKLKEEKREEARKSPEYSSGIRERNLIKNYGITIDDYEVMLERQGGVCAICKKIKTGEDTRRLAVDHDHSTGKIRGLLCGCCNRAIGQLKDDFSNLRNAYTYLRRYEENRTWDSYFIEFARLASTRSKDPSSQVGAVLVRKNLILSTGYNGLPKGVDDNKEERYDRPLKYEWICHAEENAICNAALHGVKCEGATLYVSPFNPCYKCARAIVQSGVVEVVVDSLFYNPRYEEDFKIAKEILDAAGVQIRIIDST